MSTPREILDHYELRNPIVIMKLVRIGDVPLEWFTGVGELRKHDRLGNDLTYKDVLFKPRRERAPGYVKSKPTLRARAMQNNCTHTILSNGVRSVTVRGLLTDRAAIRYDGYAGYKVVKYIG